jgi:CheY-like chemotaxis protein
MHDDFITGSGRGAAVLIVEDDGDLAQVLCAQALAEWQKRSFDLVVSDINMPNGDGITLAESLQRSEAVPLIFITGFKEDYERRLKEVENVTVLEKPFDIKMLLRLIDAVLDGKAKGDDGRRTPTGVGID